MEFRREHTLLEMTSTDERVNTTREVSTFTSIKRDVIEICYHQQMRES